MAMSDDFPSVFAVLVGGKHARANIELHDVQFIVAHSIEETIPTLRQRWWGEPASLHIDAYAALRMVDGYMIYPMPILEEPANGPALYFVNTGGYEPGVFGELHAYSFHVISDRKAIWAEAQRRAAYFTAPHQDNFDRVDDIICIDDVLRAQNYGLVYDKHPMPNPPGPQIVARYMKL